MYGNFQGLPPLCVCVSQHEVVYDQAMLLAKRAKEQGVDVTIGVWKYSAKFSDGSVKESGSFECVSGDLKGTLTAYKKNPIWFAT